MTDKLLEDAEMHISVQDSCAMFDQLLDMITGATQKVLDRAEGRCDYMLIVGGFAESTYLVEKLRHKFSSSVTHRIVSPDVPSQAVLKGKSCCILLCLTGWLMLCATVQLFIPLTVMLPGRA